MNYAALLRTDKPVRTGLVGLGAFGLSFLRQSRRMTGLTVGALCDRDMEMAQASLLAMGMDEAGIVPCESAAAATRAMERGCLPLVPDGTLLAELPLDVVVEASGSPAAGAVHGWAALEGGKHLVMVNKETACTVGPALAAAARRNGKVYTMADGDQPSIVMDMVTWAWTNGLEVVCAGKAGETDQAAEADGPGLWRIQDADGDALRETIRKRSARIPHARRVRVPDIAEMAIVINESGLGYDVPRLHGPALHYREMAQAMRAEETGGLLGTTPVVEIVNLISHPHTPSMAGGVFLVIRNQGGGDWSQLAGKRHLVSRDGQHIFLFRPYHLLGLETGISVLAAARLGVPTSGHEVRPRVDMTCRMEVDRPRGHVLGMNAGHIIADLQPELTDTRSVAPANPIPYYLAADRPLARDVKQGQILRYQDVRVDESTLLWRLRTAQDARLAT